MTIYLFYPEFFLSLIILIQLLFNSTIVTKSQYNNPILINEIFLQSIFILFCLITLLFKLELEGYSYSFIFSIDHNLKSLKIFLLIIVLLSLIFIKEGCMVQKLNFFEFYVFTLFFILSCFLLVSTFDLIIMYLLLELQALSFYILASFSRDSTFSSEAGLKYFIFGSITSCFFLLGISLIYATTGTLNLDQLTNCLNFKKLNTIFTFAILFVLFTFLFKIAVFPFHFWSPDVYEGSPISSTLLFATCSKITIVYIVIKFILTIGNCFNNIDSVLKCAGVLSITVGSFLSLKQKRLKRFIIYSSIAQVGFIILGIGVHTFESISYAYFFIAVYSLSSILIWGYLIAIYKNQSIINTFKSLGKKPIFISNLAEHSKFNIISTTSLALIFFSAAGVPPLSGFLSKILIILETVHSRNDFLAIFILIISSIPMFYYIRIIKINFFEPQKNRFLSIQTQFMNFNSLGADKIYFSLTFSLIILIYTFFTPEFILLHSSLLLFTY